MTTPKLGNWSHSSDAWRFLPHMVRATAMPLPWGEPAVSWERADAGQR